MSTQEIVNVVGQSGRTLPLRLNRIEREHCGRQFDEFRVVDFGRKDRVIDKNTKKELEGLPESDRLEVMVRVLMLDFYQKEALSNCTDDAIRQEFATDLVLAILDMALPSRQQLLQVGRVLHRKSQGRLRHYGSHVTAEDFKKDTGYRDVGAAGPTEQSICWKSYLSPDYPDATAAPVELLFDEGLTKRYLSAEETNHHLTPLMQHAEALLESESFVTTINELRAYVGRLKKDSKDSNLRLALRALKSRTVQAENGIYGYCLFRIIREMVKTESIDGGSLSHHYNLFIHTPYVYLQDLCPGRLPWWDDAMEQPLFLDGLVPYVQEINEPSPDAITNLHSVLQGACQFVRRVEEQRRVFDQIIRVDKKSKAEDSYDDARVYQNESDEEHASGPSAGIGSDIELMRRLLDQLAEVLGDKAVRAYRLHLGEKRSLRSIGTELGVSKSWVHNAVKKVQKELKSRFRDAEFK